MGVLFAGYGPGTKDVNRDNELRNCHIHHTGQLILATPGVFVWQSGHNRLVNNLIHDTPYCAVVISGRITYNRLGKGECARTIRWHEIDAANGGQKSLGDWYAREPFMHARHNLLAFNEMHSVMQVLGDGNFVYVSGCGTGNTIRNNFMHDSGSYNINGNIRCDNDQHETRVGEQRHPAFNRRRSHQQGQETRFETISLPPSDPRPSRGSKTLTLAVTSSCRPNSLKAPSMKETSTWQTRKTAPLSFTVSDVRETERGCGVVGCGNANPTWNVYWNTQNANWADEFFAEVRPKGVDRNSISADPGFVDWEPTTFA